MGAIEDLVIMITGCSSGIGRALVEEFSVRGHRVLATARSRESMADLASDRVRLIELDVTDEQSITDAVADCLEWAGRVDVVVNNAGYALVGPMSELDIDDIRTQFETNVVGLVAVAQAVIPSMVESRQGRIVNIGSVSGLTTTPFGGAYSATKAAVHMISDAMRMELAPFGIEVITIQPGSIRSSFGARAAVDVDRFQEGSLYSSLEDQIQERAAMSQKNPTPAGEFASQVVDAVTATKPPAVFRSGHGSRILAVMAHLPVWLRDSILSRRFKLERLQ